MSKHATLTLIMCCVLTTAYASKLTQTGNALSGPYGLMDPNLSIDSEIEIAWAAQPNYVWWRGAVGITTYACTLGIVPKAHLHDLECRQTSEKRVDKVGATINTHVNIWSPLVGDTTWSDPGWDYGIGLNQTDKTEIWSAMRGDMADIGIPFDGSNLQYVIDVGKSRVITELYNSASVVYGPGTELSFGYYPAAPGRHEGTLSITLPSKDYYYDGNSNGYFVATIRSVTVK